MVFLRLDPSKTLVMAKFYSVNRSVAPLCERNLVICSERFVRFCLYLQGCRVVKVRSKGPHCSSNMKGNCYIDICLWRSPQLHFGFLLFIVCWPFFVFAQRGLLRSTGEQVTDARGNCWCLPSSPDVTDSGVPQRITCLGHLQLADSYCFFHSLPFICPRVYIIWSH